MRILTKEELIISFNISGKNKIKGIVKKKSFKQGKSNDDKNSTILLINVNIQSFIIDHIWVELGHFGINLQDEVEIFGNIIIYYKNIDGKIIKSFKIMDIDQVKIF